ncbi:DUF397 domain-containing protein [Embleya sp. NPDC005575]|uniref:DUF397 domain-containing protein n=1 Tax=Embleya sp. NPDC005575 TaxID=3156892 RepID=UPI0033B94DEE
MNNQNHGRATPPPVSAWRKSSHSGEGNACVETAPLGSAVGVRDSKVTDGPVQTYDVSAWSALTEALKLA